MGHLVSFQVWLLYVLDFVHPFILKSQATIKCLKIILAEFSHIFLYPWKIKIFLSKNMSYPGSHVQGLMSPKILFHAIIIPMAKIMTNLLLSV